MLRQYSWPGNVRELKNVIESMIVIDSDGVLDVDDLTEDLQAVSAATPGDKSAAVDSLLGKPLEEIEKHYITETLKLSGGNREEAAQDARHRRTHALPQDQGIWRELIPSYDRETS